VVHFDGLDFGGDICGGEGDDHTSLDNTSFDTTDGHRTDTTDFVHILERKTKWLVGGTAGGLNRIDGIKERLAFGSTALDFLGPALVPRHAEGDVSIGCLGERNVKPTWATPRSCCHRASQKSGRRGPTWGCSRLS